MSKRRIEKDAKKKGKLKGDRKNKHLSFKERGLLKLMNLKYRYLTNKRPDLAKKLEDDMNAQ